MKEKNLMTVVLVLLILPTLLFSQQTNTVSIYGTVTGGNSDQPLAGVRVEAINEADTSQRASAITGNDGHYSINLTTNAESQMPAEFRLFQNYPNPFNPSTLVRFQIPQTAEVRLDIYNILGQKIRTLLKQQLSQGIYTAEWDATNDAGAGVAAGIYLYRLMAVPSGNPGQSYAHTRKMILFDGGVGRQSGNAASSKISSANLNKSDHFQITLRATSPDIVFYEQRQVEVTSQSLQVDIEAEQSSFLINGEYIVVSEPVDGGNVYVSGLAGAVICPIKQFDYKRMVTITNLRTSQESSGQVNGSGGFGPIIMGAVIGDLLQVRFKGDLRTFEVIEGVPPSVVETKPTDGDKDIIVDVVITVHFSEPIETSSLNQRSFTLTDSLNRPVPGVITVHSNNMIAMLDPIEPLAYNASYTITVTTDVTDLQGLHLDSDYTATFTTAPLVSNGNYINVPADVPTIQAGIDSATNGDTVLVWPGEYYEHINFNGKNIVVGSLTLITGDPSYISQTVIHQVNQMDSSVVTFENGENATAVFSGFKISPQVMMLGPRGISVINSSPTISHTHLKKNFVWGPGGGIKLINSNSLLFNVRLDSNLVQSANGDNIYCKDSNPILINVEISGGFGSPSPLPQGKGIYFEDSNLILINAVLSDLCDIRCYSSNLVLINSIVWENHGYPLIYLMFSKVAVTFSDIAAGQSGIYIGPNSTVYWLDGNINANPMFVDPYNDFRLQAGSPCIDAGIQDTMIIYNSGQDTLFVPAMNYVGTAPDMGAYEFGATEGMRGKQNNGFLRPKDTKPLEVK